MGTIFNIFIEFIAKLFLHYILLLGGYEACGIQVLWPYFLHWKAKS